MRVSIHTVISKYHSTLAVTGESLEEQLIPCLGLGVFESGNTYFVVPESQRTLKANGVVSKGHRNQHEKSHCGQIRGCFENQKY